MIINNQGFTTLSPLFVFVGLYLGLSIIAGNFYKVPMTVIFIISSIYTIAISAETPLKGSYDLFEWMGAMGNGVISMGKLIIITMMAEGMLGYPKTYS